MYARSIRVSRFAAIVSLAALPFLMTGTAEAYQCKIVKTYAQAIGPAQAATIANAKTIWATKVKNKLDLQWSSWDIAASKSQNCAWTGNNYQCTVGAKPCLYVVP
jgi:hypothetical protein